MESLPVFLQLDQTIEIKVHIFVIYLEFLTFKSLYLIHHKLINSKFLWIYELSYKVLNILKKNHLKI